MTENESFPQRVRGRMASTGERYAAAQRSQIEAADPSRRRVWHAEPEFGDAAIEDATGKRWDDWCDVLDAWPGRAEGHTAIAAYLRDERGIDPWWAQSITVGYERIVGLRQPGEMPDGTFTANTSATIVVNADLLRSMLLDDAGRSDLFGGREVTLRSESTSKKVRLGMDPGVAQLSIEARPTGRTKVAVQHSKLPGPEAVDEWKYFWADWFEALDEG